ncbi:hypothetical protein ACFCT7_11075 [Fulvivirgaceae bacterium LMO-SS25]
MKLLQFLSLTLFTSLLAFACSSDNAQSETEAASAEQQWVISDSIVVDLALAQIRPFDYNSDKKLFLGSSNRNDLVIFDENGSVLHEIKEKPAGDPNYLGNWKFGTAFFEDDKILVQPNMSDQMLIADYDGNVTEKVQMPYLMMVSASKAGPKCFEIEENKYLLYAPGRYNEIEVSKNGFKEFLFEIWDRESNTFTPTIKLPEGHPHNKPPNNRFFPEFMYKDGRLFLYTRELPEIYIYQWDGADFQYERTIKLNFSKFVSYPVSADGGIDIFAVLSGNLLFLSQQDNVLHVVYREGIEEERYSTMSEEEKQMSGFVEPVNKVAKINLDDFTEMYEDLPMEVIPYLAQAGEGRWIGLKNIYLKMEEEDYPTLYFMERR